MNRLALIALLLPGCGYAQQVPASFFSQDILTTSHMPTVPYGGARLWDAGVTWNAINTANGVYTWTRLDALLSAAQTAGVDVNLGLSGTPNWASSVPNDTNCASNYANNAVTSNGACDPPSDVDSGDNYFKAYVTALVQHSIASSTAHIKYYTLCNEPNQDATHPAGGRFWVGTNAQLLTMAIDAAAIIHRLDPSAIVISPEPTYDGRYPNGPSDWFGPYFAAGGTTQQDVIGFHYYPHDSFGNYGADPEAELSYFDNLKSLMASYGIGSKPIYVMEGNWGNIATLTPTQEAAWVVKHHLLLLHKQVRRVYWYAWDSWFATGTCSNAWGKMWDSSLGVCPAGTAYQWLQTYLAGGITAQPFCSNGGDDTWSCLFQTAAGKPAQFLWNINSASKTLTVDSRFKSCLNIDGTTCTITSNTVSVGSSPILLLP